MTHAPFITRIAALCCVGVIALALPARAAAHAFLVQSTPQADQQLSATPPAITLQFSEAIASAANDRVALASASGEAVGLGPLALTRANTLLTVSLPRLAAGAYVVSWQVVSADDGHLSAGQFAFAVGRVARLPVLSNVTSAPAAWPEAVAGWLFLLGLAAGAGGVAGELLVWQPLARRQRWAAPRAPIRIALGLALLGAAGQFALFTARLSQSSLWDGLDPRRWLNALQVQAGVSILAALFLVSYALVLRSLTKRQVPVLAALLIAAYVSALRSHPAARAWWGAWAVALHVGLAALWGGMLADAVLALWRRKQPLPSVMLLAALHRYARLALWSVLGIVVSGLVSALALLSDPGQLVDTSYGRILLIKGFLVAGALALALLSRSRLRSGPAVPLHLLRRSMGAETFLLAGVLAAAALLSNVAPPYTPPSAASAEALPSAPAPVGPALHLADQAGWLEVYLTASQGQAVLRLLTPDDQAPQDVRVSLVMRSPSGPGGDLVPQSCGTGCYYTPIAWRQGATSLLVRVDAGKWAGGTVRFAVAWPPLPESPRLLAQLITAMRAQRNVVIAETVRSGPGAVAQDTARLSGVDFLRGEPYGGQVGDVRGLPDDGGLHQLVIDLPGSNIWVHLWTDAQHRLRREVIVSVGHLIQRTFSYPLH